MPTCSAGHVALEKQHVQEYLLKHLIVSISLLIPKPAITANHAGLLMNHALSTSMSLMLLLTILLMTYEALLIRCGSFRRLANTASISLMRFICSHNLPSMLF